GPGDGVGHGHPGAPRAHRSVRDRRGDGGRQRCPVRSARRRHPDDGVRLHAPRVHRGRGRRHGQSRRVEPGGDLHQPGRGLCRAGGEPGPGGDRVLRRAGPDHARQADRAVRPHPEMTLAGARSDRGATGYWVGFAVVLAALSAAPLILPPFWQRFVTEILIWGLLAMSSDILIGYTGMVSFGHSAFFGLGMYGAAAALLSVKPPNLWLAGLYGLIGAGAVAVCVAYFATRL